MESAGTFENHINLPAKLFMAHKTSVPVRQEEDITQNSVRVLNLVSELLNLQFNAGNQHLRANPDIVASTANQIALKLPTSYDSPSSRPFHRNNVAKSARLAMRYIIETKPFWKYREFLVDDFNICENWKLPLINNCTTGKEMPKSFPNRVERLVHHLIRQVYGQMVTDDFRFGVFHMYEVWWFCKRTDDGTLLISDRYQLDSLSPSILQILYAMGHSNEHFLKSVPARAQQSPVETKIDTKAGSNMRDNRKSSQSSKTKGAGTKNAMTIAAPGPPSTALCLDTIQLEDCDLLMTSKYMKLLATPCGRGVLKMVRDTHRMKDAVRELENEVAVYRHLQAQKCTGVPVFYGCSDRLGLCVERGESDFEDIGIENISSDLKQSAMQVMGELSRCGVLHGDVALRNFVRSTGDPNKALVIDFGRARLVKDTKMLEQQVVALQTLLYL